MSVKLDLNSSPKLCKNCYAAHEVKRPFHFTCVHVPKQHCGGRNLQGLYSQRIRVEVTLQCHHGEVSCEMDNRRPLKHSRACVQPTRGADATYRECSFRAIFKKTTATRQIGGSGLHAQSSCESQSIAQLNRTETAAPKPYIRVLLTGKASAPIFGGDLCVEP